MRHPETLKDRFTKTNLPRLARPGHSVLRNRPILRMPHPIPKLAASRACQGSDERGSPIACHHGGDETHESRRCVTPCALSVGARVRTRDCRRDVAREVCECGDRRIAGVILRPCARGLAASAAQPPPRSASACRISSRAVPRPPGACNRTCAVTARGRRRTRRR